MTLYITNKIGKLRTILFVIIISLTFPIISLSETHQLTIRGIQRTFILYVPSSYDGIKPLPVLLMFHGLGATAALAASNYYGWLDCSEINRFFVVFPESLNNLVPVLGQTKYWDINPGSADSQDIDFIRAIIEWMDASYKIRNTHIFCTGHSNGAFFSYYVAVHLHDLISVFGAHSGGIIHALQSWPTSIPADDAIIKGLLLHSPGDSIVPYSYSQDLYTDLISGGHISELIALDVGLDHQWDKTKNQIQIDFFMAHAPAINVHGDGVIKTMPWLPLLLND